MPATIELALRPASEGPDPTARQLHGLVCRLFETPGSDHERGEKPFTVWPLRRADDGWLLRAAWLREEFPAHVLAGCGQVQLGPVAYAVTDLAFRPVPHAELASVPEIDGIRLTLLSPTYFKQNGTVSCGPDLDPRLLVGAWRRRWDSSLPPGSSMVMGPDLGRDIHLALHVTGSGLRTEERDTGYKAKGGGWLRQQGLVGTVTLRLESGASPAVRHAFGTLARFAEYCGTGAQVTHGFGATKTTVLRSSWSAEPGLSESEVS